ncbi:conserved phage C-terminal domain-containing protein [Fructilactobacillus florum]
MIKKCEQWGKDEYWSKFLRPETLFGTKFEGYLNEKTKPVEKKSEYDDIF